MHYSSIFQQLFNFIPRHRFEKSVENLSGDRMQFSQNSGTKPAGALVIARREKSCNGNTSLQSFEYVQQEEKLHKSPKPQRTRE